MCRQSIYYNTYGDGTKDVTERVDTCRPGKMCANPEVREYKRSFRFNKLDGGHSSSVAGHETPSSLAERKPTPYHADFLALPPTPRKSKSPSPSRDSGVYVNGAKIADIHSSTKKRTSHRRSDRVVVVPEPPSPLPALRRSSTMPDYVVLDVPQRGRSSRPTSTSSSSSSGDHHHRRHHRHVLLDPAHSVEDLGRRTTRHAPRSPSRAERHGRRDHHPGHRRSPAVYYSSDGSDTPAAAAVRKELRWQDLVDRERAAQNERISRRPKPMLHQQQEVKGILKKSPADPYKELRRAVAGMDIHSGDAEVRGRRVAKVQEDAAYWDRLRGRFDEPKDKKRRSRVHYPGESVYKYM